MQALILANSCSNEHNKVSKQLRGEMLLVALFIELHPVGGEAFDITHNLEALN